MVLLPDARFGHASKRVSRHPRSPVVIGFQILVLLGVGVVSARVAFVQVPHSARMPSRCGPSHCGRTRSQSRTDHRAGGTVSMNALQAAANVELIKTQNMAGHAMRDLGLHLETLQFHGKSLEGKVRVTFDGIQRLQQIEIEADALKAAQNDRGALAAAVLTAMAQAHEKSDAETKGDVWRLYQNNSELLQAPLVQIGAGSTSEDLWANVTRTEETVRLTEELFDRFDEDGDGFWNLKETSQVQLATEGTEMAEDAFNSLIIAAAPDGGRNLSEEDLEKGLSKDQVIELYTDANRQRQLGFVLDIFKDHAAAVLEKGRGASEGTQGQASESVD